MNPEDKALPVHRIGTAVVIEMPVEVDYYVRDAATEQALALLEERPERLVVDMSGCTFCDSSGLAILLRVRGPAEEAGVLLDVVVPHPTVRRVFELAGADFIFRLHTTLHEALASAPGAPSSPAPACGSHVADTTRRGPA
ncbi:hypothetical protein GCM10027294_08410 [Marinactinospora endophytica]